MTAKHKSVIRDIEHKISKAVVDVAVQLKANKIVLGDTRDIADEVNKGKNCNQKISSWQHGYDRRFITYKSKSKGICVVLEEEHWTSQTCPICGGHHKSKGRNFVCPFCGFRCHRDVLGQINILSKHKLGKPGKLPVPTLIMHRIPHNLRVMRRCGDTHQIEKSVACCGQLQQEAAGF